ncbi:MAG: hypothetical protein QOH63_1974 [Acidobacteriota bacterium]|jgi:hypothetical protein|nr:hypothetical protein [Acidobacteriota bacterium]
MPYVIPTSNGYFVINDEKRHTLAIAYTKEEEGFLFEKRRLMVRQNSGALVGLEIVCEEEREEKSGIKVLTIYFAHPGTFRFVSGESTEAERYRIVRERLEAIG